MIALAATPASAPYSLPSPPMDTTSEIALRVPDDHRGGEARELDGETR